MKPTYSIAELKELFKACSAGGMIIFMDVLIDDLHLYPEHEMDVIDDLMTEQIAKTIKKLRK